ncbi:MAG: hypothetical protein QOJ46_1966 [bacterium]
MRARLACLAAVALALTAARAQALTYPSPYGSGPRAAVNAAGLSVVAWAGPSGLRAATGNRSSGFAAPATLGGSDATSPQVGIDGAGTAIVVWETTRTVTPKGCGKDCVSIAVSTGVWASLRPAGGGFQPAIALAGPQSDHGAAARPRLAMSANGHAVIAWTSEDGAMASLRGPGGPIQQAQRVAPRPFGVASVAVTDAGEVLVGGPLGQLVVRPPNGSYAAPRTFPGAATVDAAAIVAANARGDAFVAYPAATGGFLVARRPAAGDWGAATSLPALQGGGLRSAAMTGSGDGVLTWTQTEPAVGPTSGVMAAIVTASAAPVVQRMTTPDASADASFEGGGLAAGAGADVVAGWDRQGVNIGARRVAQIAIRRAPGGFGAPITLTPADGDHPIGDFPGVGIDAGGVVLATWVDHHPGQSRVKAIWLAANAVSPVAILETTAAPDAPTTSFPPEHFASVLFSAALTPTRRGFVGVPLTCFSTDGQVCRGTITLRPAAGKPRAGRAHFRVPAGKPKRVFVGLSRRTRARLRREPLIPMLATVANTKAGGGAGRRTTASVFVAGRRPKVSR